MASHPDPQEQLRRLMRELGHEFADKSLLIQALTHRSYVNESSDAGVLDNERFEFLGDSVIALVVSTELMTRHPLAREGTLSRIRASMVDEPALARLARDLGLGEAMRLGRGEDLSGGRIRSSLLSDTFEAVIGAVYIDAGFERVREVLLPRLRFPEGAMIPGDPKTELQERLQAERHVTPTYRVAGEDGPDHNKTFIVELLIEGEVMGQAQGRTKKEAERAVAAGFLAGLEQVPAPPMSTEPATEAALPPATSDEDLP